MESSRSFIPAFRRALLPVALGIVVALVANARHSLNETRAFQTEMAAVSVVAPEGRPEFTQESIDLALVMYGIQVPDTAERPKLDMRLKDRGLTTRATFLERAVVTIGPAAFESWGLLGSTIAHEVEVHCEQNFLAIYFMDLAGLDGTGAAERQAYAHELRNAKRFGLGRADADLIADTMEFYYPETGSAATEFMPRTLRTWLAKNVIYGQSAR